MLEIIDRLKDTPFPVYLSSFSALDTYFDSNNQIENVYAVAFTNLVEIAKVFTTVDYPGIEEADALIRIGEKTLFLKCLDSFSDFKPYTYTVQNLLFYVQHNKYIDRRSVYWDLRGKELHPVSGSFSVDFTSGISLWRPVIDTAILLSRFHYEVPGNLMHPPDTYPPLPEKEQRAVLTDILTGIYPERGLQFLSQTGFLRQHWPELEKMRTITHSKEHHPEGGVWDHTLETFRYRKIPDLTISLGLLLHDIGKVYAQNSNGRKFNKHAQIGASVSGRFLGRLGFSNERVRKVQFLVKNHMLPAYIADLPAFRTEEIMSSPLFPHLLEVYRCDISSSFSRLTEYYRACKTYRRFLKNKNNPYRSSDGKKILRMYLE